MCGFERCAWRANTEPCPAGAEDFEGRRREELLERRYASKRLDDRALQRRALWLLRTAIGRHTPEEEVVVDVAAAGVADATLDPGILDLIHVLKKLVDAHLRQVLLVWVGPQFGEGGVQFVRVGLMMLEVVDAHGGGIDVGLQRLVVVWDRWQGQVLRERHAVQQRDHRSDDDKRSRRLDAASRSQT